MSISSCPKLMLPEFLGKTRLYIGHFFCRVFQFIASPTVSIWNLWLHNDVVLSPISMETKNKIVHCLLHNRPPYLQRDFRCLPSSTSCEHSHDFGLTCPLSHALIRSTFWNDRVDETKAFRAWSMDPAPSSHTTTIPAIMTTSWTVICVCHMVQNQLVPQNVPIYSRSLHLPTICASYWQNE